MDVAIYLRRSQRKCIEEYTVFCKERSLVYCKQKKYIPMIVMEAFVFGETVGECRISERSFYLYLDTDECRCIISKEEIEKFLKGMCKVPFRSIQHLTDWITFALEPAFSYIEVYVNQLRKMICVELGTPVFQKRKVVLEIKYKEGLFSEIYVVKAKIRDSEKSMRRFFSRLKKNKESTV